VPFIRKPTADVPLPSASYSVWPRIFSLGYWSGAMPTLAVPLIPTSISMSLPLTASGCFAQSASLPFG
jgi:hypothetical protein